MYTAQTGLYTGLTYNAPSFFALMIAVGCTGGAHRSVAISEALGAHLRALDVYKRQA